MLDTAHEIDVHTLAAMRADRTDHTVLDIREQDEIAICTIGNCLAVPMQEVPQHVDSLPRHHPLILLCHHGVRSGMVTEFLRKNGFGNAWNLAGGIDAWAREIAPEMPRY